MAKFLTINAVVPKARALKALDSRIVARTIDIAFRDGAEKVQEDFGKTVETWNTAVVFLISRPDLDTAEIKVAPGHPAKIYGYVDQGTKAHAIRARNVPYLRIPRTFVLKTKPGRLQSVAGERSDDAYFRREVWHPGIKARKFTKTILKKWKKSWPKLFAKHLKKLV